MTLFREIRDSEREAIAKVGLPSAKNCRIGSRLRIDSDGIRILCNQFYPNPDLKVSAGSRFIPLDILLAAVELQNLVDDGVIPEHFEESFVCGAATMCRHCEY